MREKANAQTGEITANGLNSKAKIRNVGFGTLQMPGTTNGTLWTNCGPTEGLEGCSGTRVCPYAAGTIIMKRRILLTSALPPDQPVS